MARRRGGQARRHARGIALRRWALLTVGMGLLAVLAVVGVARGGSQGGGEAGEDSSRPLAPDFRLSVYQGQDALGGQPGSLGEIVGKGVPVVLNFWAGLCPPCRTEMPGFQRVYQERKGDFLLIGVDVGPFTGLGSVQDGVELVESLGITFPIVDVPDGRSLQLYGVRSMPTTVFITADGRIYRRVSGAMSARQFSGLVDELVQASRVATPS